VGLHQDASFIRLRDLTLSYDLPPAIEGFRTRLVNFKFRYVPY
jgi:hypothetical protein